MDPRDWKETDDDLIDDYTEISPLLVTQKRDEHVSPTIIESLDYDSCPNEPYMNYISTKTKSIISYLNIKDWVMFSLIGFMTGTVAFLIDVAVRHLTKWKFEAALYYIGSNKFSDFFTVPMFLFVTISLVYCTIAAITVVITPEAAGSGIPEIKCYLNGIRLPKVVRFKTLLCKAFGVLFSVSGGLPCGKEGPMIHSGAVLGAGIPEALSRLIKRLGYKDSPFGVHDDRDKRDFISAGAAAGVSAAFGAPLGGVLFSLEEGSSFWNQALTWKTLFCSMSSAFILQVLKSAMEDRSIRYEGLINFGEFKCQDGTEECKLWGFQDLLIFILMGAVGGLLGALFNQLNYWLTKYRMTHVNPKGNLARVSEVLLIAIVISTTCYTASFTVGHCVQWSNNSTAQEIRQTWREGYCPSSPGSVNNLSNDYMTIAFNSQEDSIKTLFHHFNYKKTNGEKLDTYTYHPLTLVVFFVLTFFFTCWTYGIGVPSGLFVPCLLIGATYGRLCALIYQNLTEITRPASFYPGSYALIGAAAFLGGVVRMTISLTVILIETTRNISYGLPIMITLMVAKWVGDMFNKGLYDIHIELKHWPLLEWEAHPVWETMSARDIMKSNIEWLNPKPTVGRIVDILKRTKHSAYPVCTYKSTTNNTRIPTIAIGPSTNNTKSHLSLQGLIMRSQIVTLLKKDCYRDPLAPAVQLTYSELTEFYPKYPDIEDTTIPLSDQNKILDFTWYMNPCPYTVSPRAPVTKVFTLFRSLGLRHLMVVNNVGELEGIITRAELQEHNLDNIYNAKLEIEMLSRIRQANTIQTPDEPKYAISTPASLLTTNTVMEEDTRYLHTF